MNRYAHNIEAEAPIVGSVKAGLIVLGSIRLCTIIVTSVLQLIGGRPGHERFYDPANNLSYCSGPEEIVDNSTGKSYTLRQEIVRNSWDNLPYQVRTGKILLEEKIKTNIQDTTSVSSRTSN